MTPLRSAPKVVAWLLAALLAVLPLAGNTVRAQNVDPLFLRNVIERMLRFGGTIYQNGIYNKGWLEPVAYLAARKSSTYHGFWFTISILISLCAAVLAVAALITTRRMGGKRAPAIAVALAVYIHFTMGAQQYSGVLYSRNLTVTLLGAAWVLVLADTRWATERRRNTSALALGLLLGIAVQGLTTTALAAGVIALAGILALRCRHGSVAIRTPLVVGVTSGAFAILAPILWYGIRGGLAEYWASWWTYARMMSLGTGRSLAGQLALGAEQFVAYYRARPVTGLLLLAFVAVSGRRWRSMDRVQRLISISILAWLVAAWLELTISQRYSEHYFVVLAFPSALALAGLMGHVFGLGGARVAWLQRPALLPLTLSISMLAVTGIERMTGYLDHFTNIHRAPPWMAERDRHQSAGNITVRAVLDTISEPNDALLAWTIDPFVYFKYQRVPASRLQWRSFMLGEIYLGQSGPQYVLPGTWDWFEQDIVQTQPKAFIETEPFDSGTPFETVILEHFTPAYRTADTTLWLNNEAFEDLTAQLAVSERGPDYWSSMDLYPEFDDGATHHVSDTLPGTGLLLARSSCLRLDGRLGAEHAEISFGIRFLSEQEGVETMSVSITGSDQASNSVRFSLSVGAKAAVLAVEDQILSAVRLDGPTALTILEPRSPTLTLLDLRETYSTSLAGCPQR